MQAKQNYFNSYAKKWDTVNRNDMNKVDILLRLLDIQQGDTVLDVGTGTGVLLPLLSSYTPCANITAIDIAAKMIAEAKQKAAGKDIAFITGDATSHPFTQTFDHVICYHVFPHFDDHLLALKKFSSILNNGGLLSVIHSLSRERINRFHGSIEIVQNDFLEPMNVLAGMMERCGLIPEIMIDNSEMYAVCARKIA
jgi:demethylmenaquinone methyltransferase/2-methoxy-6-polyprenyl-1,4-benzoquinol methylase